jgi:hypothetical protein
VQKLEAQRAPENVFMLSDGSGAFFRDGRVIPMAEGEEVEDFRKRVATHFRGDWLMDDLRFAYIEAMTVRTAPNPDPEEARIDREHAELNFQIIRENLEHHRRYRRPGSAFY